MLAAAANMSSDSPLKGKVAIITGSSKDSGIGAACAFVLAEQGANIVVQYNRNVSRAQTVVDKIKEYGVDAIAVQADAASLDFGQKLVDAALKAFTTSSIDIVVNCVGTIVMSAGISEVAPESWDQAFHINVRSAFLVIQAAVLHMRPGGRIVNMGSVAAKMGHKFLPVFSASKAAVTAMSVSLAEELGPKDITINVVAPGPIATEAEGFDPALMGPVATKMFNNAHLKRVGTVEEVAAAVKWLTSPLAGYVTGQVISVDGGIGWP